MDTPLYICFSTSLDISFAPKKIVSPPWTVYLQLDEVTIPSTKSPSVPRIRKRADFVPAVLSGRFIRWFPWDSKRHLAFCCWCDFSCFRNLIRDMPTLSLVKQKWVLKDQRFCKVRGGCCDAAGIIYFSCLSSYFLDFLSTILPCKEQAHTTTPQPLPSRNQGITKPNSSYWGLFNRSRYWTL